MMYIKRDNILSILALFFIALFFIVPATGLIIRINSKVLIFRNTELFQSLLNSFSYAFVTSVFQVAFGLIVAYTFTINNEYLSNTKKRILQFIIDVIIIIPYITPSVFWFWIYEVATKNNETSYFIFDILPILKSDNNNSFQLFFYSIIHLYPFSYLAFRYFFSKTNIHQYKYAETIGLSKFSAFIKYNKLKFFKLITFVYTFRLIIMFGKFDLPFLFKGMNTRVTPLFTFPIWAYKNQLSDLTKNTSYISQLLVFIILIYIIINKIIKTNLNRPRIRIKPTYKIPNWIIIFLHYLVILLGFAIVIATTSLFIYPLINLKGSLILKGLFRFENYCSSILYTYIYTLIVFTSVIFMSYLVLIVFKYYKGLIIEKLEYFFIILFIVPSVVFSYLIYLYNGIFKFQIINYIYLLLIFVLPLSFYKIKITLDLSTDEHLIFLRNLEDGVFLNYIKLNKARIGDIFRSIFIACIVIISNDFYFNMIVLNTDDVRPIGYFLNNNQSILKEQFGYGYFSTIIPIVLINIIIFILLEFLAYKFSNYEYRASS